MQSFNPQQLEKYYSNLSVIEDDQSSNYSVLDQFGNQMGQILYNNNELTDDHYKIINGMLDGINSTISSWLKPNEKVV